MFFRFGTALVLIVAISLVGTALEKRNLELRRAVSRQRYRLEILSEQQISKRVLAQQLGAPNRLVGEIDTQTAAPSRSVQPLKSDRPRGSIPTSKSRATRG
jgi:hypothetical protein